MTTDRVLRWCDTHDQPAWDYADGSVQCMYDLIVESYNEHVLGPVLLADPAPVGLTEVEIERIRFAIDCEHYPRRPDACAYCGAIGLLDRLSAAPVQEDEP